MWHQGSAVFSLRQRDAVMDALCRWLSDTCASSSVPVLVLCTENKKEICLGRHQSLFLSTMTKYLAKATWERRGLLNSRLQRTQHTVAEGTVGSDSVTAHRDHGGIQKGTRARHGPQEHTQPVIDFLCLTPPSLYPSNVIILGIYQRMNPVMRSEPSWSNRLQKQHHRHPQNCFTNLLALSQSIQDDN